MLRVKIINEQNKTKVAPIGTFQLYSNKDSLRVKMKTLNNELIVYDIQTDIKNRSTGKIKKSIEKKIGASNYKDVLLEITENREKRRIHINRIGFHRANDFRAIRVM